MKTKTYFITLTLLLFAFWGCEDDPGNPNDGNIPDILSFNIGDTWHFHDPSDTIGWDISVEGIEEIDGMTVYFTNSPFDLGCDDNSLFLIDGDSNIWARFKLIDFEDEQEFFFSVDSNQIHIQLDSESTQISTPAGNFTCKKYNMTINNQEFYDSFWINEPTGIVQFGFHNDTVIHPLESYNFN